MARLPFICTLLPLLLMACEPDGAGAKESQPISNTDDTATTSDDTAATSDDTAATSDDTGATSDDTGTTSDDTGTTSDDTGTTSDDTGTTSDDTGSVDPPDPEGTWTEGPALPDCTPTEHEGSAVALSGVLLLPDGPEAGIVRYDRTTGLITCAGADCSTDDATVVCTEGVISPGLIDAHNHMQYNVLPPWQHDWLFDDRYDWRSSGAYWSYRTAYDEIEGSANCDIMKWAELRSLVSGTTSVVGSSGGSCINVLIRNLEEDEDAHGLSGYGLYYSASTVTDRFEAGDIITPGGSFDAVANHVAEGVGGSVRDELEHMMTIGMSGAGQVYVHATDATTAHLAAMADEGTAIAWSPRSNLDLYGATTPIDVAHRIGVPIVLGPDWTWSGSMNPVREMQCAREWLDARDSSIDDATVWSWTTHEAARLLGVDSHIGSLTSGLAADISVYDWSGWPYHAVIQAEPAAVRLVIVGGEALYGNSSLMGGLTEHPDWCEEIDACDTTRTVCVKAGTSGEDARLAEDIETYLSSALAEVTMPAGYEYANELLGLFSCEETRDSCDPRISITGDEDGDGVMDDEDICPWAYDPDQWDHDGDGSGDACDPCPLDPLSDECTSSPGDVDGDGIATDEDVCPWVTDPDQDDADEDGVGDACDLCPDEYSPGDTGCTYTIPMIRDPTDPGHPPVGTTLTVNDVVVIGIRDGNGFYVQDPTASAYAGLFVYHAGSLEESEIPNVGEQVSITGMYAEYYDLTEITSPTVTVTGEGLIEPITVDDPCTVGTGGSLAEELESMLVEVSDLTVTDSNPDAPEDYGEFVVNDCLRVDDQLSDVLIPQPDVDTTLPRLAGVLSFTYANSKVLPRGPDDVE